MPRRAEWASSGVRGGDGELVSCVELPCEGVRAWSDRVWCVDTESLTDGTDPQHKPRAGCSSWTGAAGSGSFCGWLVVCSSDEDALVENCLAVSHELSKPLRQNESPSPLPTDLDRRRSARVVPPGGVTCNPQLFLGDERPFLGVAPPRSRRGVVGELGPLLVPKPSESNEKSDENDDEKSPNARSSSGSCNKLSFA